MMSSDSSNNTNGGNGDDGDDGSRRAGRDDAHSTPFDRNVPPPERV
ncbi:hypothetical protein [Trinickia dabaoshanensis]|nr:hypothetical protein [Trinickia dabaoshanensis]